jgi:hypothetical protein
VSAATVQENTHTNGDNLQGDFAVLVQAASTCPVQRKQRRSRYVCRQRIAFCSGPARTPGTFTAFQFHDLSTHGCSFLSAAPPPSEDLIVELRQKQQVICMLARTAHITPTVVDGKDAFIIGCRFIGRAE